MGQRLSWVYLKTEVLNFGWCQMPVAQYRLTSSLLAVVREGNRQRLERLQAGSILIPASSQLDGVGMIDGTCAGTPVRVFARDLEERAERIQIALSVYSL